MEEKLDKIIELLEKLNSSILKLNSKHIDVDELNKIASRFDKETRDSIIKYANDQNQGLS